jgi:hypothetical protein
MSHRALLFLLVFVWIAASPDGARGQEPAPSATQAAPTQTATQSSGQQAPAKKVWTNDDVSDLRDQSVISSFGASKVKSSTRSQKPTSKGKDANWYRNQITKLQAKVPPLNDQITELQAAIEGKPTGNGKESARPRGVKADSWQAEIDELQEQRDGILSQINALYDDARHNGIPDGDLPVQQ